jgi:hypothetical protein
MSQLQWALWRWYFAGASRRLIGAAKGTKADQNDLPRELRKKYEAVQASLPRNYLLPLSPLLQPILAGFAFDVPEVRVARLLDSSLTSSWPDSPLVSLELRHRHEK